MSDPPGLFLPENVIFDSEGAVKLYAHTINGTKELKRAIDAGDECDVACVWSGRTCSTGMVVSTQAYEYGYFEVSREH